MKKLILTLLLATQVQAHELTLYVIPSPGIDWSTPKSLLLSTLKSKLSFTPHPMGQVWVELQCGSESVLTAMSADNPDIINQVVFQQRGFGIFYHSFPGKIDTQENIEKEKMKYPNEGFINFVRFTINEGQCKRAKQYLSEFIKYDVGNSYGLAHRPRYAEGATGPAFAVSFPDELNILDQEMKEGWIDEIKIPLALAGPPVTDEGVSLFKILRADSWATDNEKQKVLKFWNPDKMYQWINQKMKLKKVGYTVTQLNKISGVVFDKTQYPVPEEPIWLQQLDPKDKTKTLLPPPPSRPPKMNKKK